MKSILFILLAVLLSSFAKADYNGYHMRLSIVQTDGTTTRGYVYIALAYLDKDSLGSTEYLKKALDQDKGSRTGDSFSYYKERIPYEYTSVWDSAEQRRSVIYYLNEKTSLPTQEIKNITVEEMIDFSYMLGISSELTMADTVWMKTKPVRKALFSGYLTDYQVFIHDTSPTINRIIKQLEAKQKEIESIELYDKETGRTDYRKGDRIDEELWEIVKQLNKYKVVIVAEYSC